MDARTPLLDKIKETFNKIQEKDFSKDLIVELIELYKSNNKEFVSGFTQCFLILFVHIDKVPQRVRDNYSQFTQDFFYIAKNQADLEPKQHDTNSILNQKAASTVAGRRGKNIKAESQSAPIMELIYYFIEFFTDTIGTKNRESQKFSIELLLKILLVNKNFREEDYQYMELRKSKKLIERVIELFKKQETRNVAIKFYNVLQSLSSIEELSDEFGRLREQILLVMSSDNSESNRCLAVKNIKLNVYTVDNLIKRLRDVNTEIRKTVYIKLQKEQASLAKDGFFNLPQVYKIIYDGFMCSKNTENLEQLSVTTHLEDYLKALYNNFEAVDSKDQDQEEGKKEGVDDNEEDGVEHKKLGDEGQDDEFNMDEEEQHQESVIRKRKDAKKPQAGDKQSKGNQKLGGDSEYRQNIFRETREKIQNFLQIFGIEFSLFYPTIYTILERLVQKMITEFIPVEHLTIYLEELLISEFKSIPSKSTSSSKNLTKPLNLSITQQQLFFIRIASSMTLVDTLRTALQSEGRKSVVTAIQTHYPAPAQIATLIEQYDNHSENIFELYQVLLLAELNLQASTDPDGSKILADCLVRFCLVIKQKDVKEPDFDRFNDVLHPIDFDELNIEMLIHPFYKPPIIVQEINLLSIVVRILKKMIIKDQNTDGPLFTETIHSIVAELYQKIDSTENGAEEEYQGRGSDNKKFNVRQIKADLEKKRTKYFEVISITENQIQSLRATEDNIKTSRITAKERAVEKEKIQQQIDEANLTLEQTRSAQSETDREINEIQDFLFRTVNMIIILSEAMMKNWMPSIDDQYCTNVFIIINSLQIPEFQLFLPQMHQFTAMYSIIKSEIAQNQLFAFGKALSDIDSDESQHYNSYVVALNWIFQIQLIFKFEIEDFKQNQELFLIALNSAEKCLWIGNDILRLVAIQGFCQMLYQEALESKNRVFAYMLMISLDDQLIESGRFGCRAHQIMTSFLQKYVMTGLDSVFDLQKAMETTLDTLVEISQMGLQFDTKFRLNTQPLDKELDQLILYFFDKISYQSTLHRMGYNDFEEGEYGPQERFFFYLCRRAVRDPEGRGAIFFKILKRSIELSQKDKNGYVLDFCYNCTKKTNVYVLRDAIERVREIHPDDKALTVFKNQIVEARATSTHFEKEENEISQRVQTSAQEQITDLEGKINEGTIDVSEIIDFFVQTKIVIKPGKVIVSNPGQKRQPSRRGQQKPTRPQYGESDNEEAEEKQQEHEEKGGIENEQIADEDLEESPLGKTVKQEKPLIKKVTTTRRGRKLNKGEDDSDSEQIQPKGQNRRSNPIINEEVQQQSDNDDEDDDDDENSENFNENVNESSAPQESQSVEAPKPQIQYQVAREAKQSTQAVLPIDKKQKPEPAQQGRGRAQALPQEVQQQQDSDQEEGENEESVEEVKDQQNVSRGARNSKATKLKTIGDSLNTRKTRGKTESKLKGLGIPRDDDDEDEEGEEESEQQEFSNDSPVQGNRREIEDNTQTFGIERPQPTQKKTKLVQRKNPSAFATQQTIEPVKDFSEDEQDEEDEVQEIEDDIQNISDGLKPVVISHFQGTINSKIGSKSNQRILNQRPSQRFKANN